MFSVQEKLKELGLIGKTGNETGSVNICDINTGEVKIILTSKELTENETAQKTWDLIQSKINV